MAASILERANRVRELSKARDAETVTLPAPEKPTTAKIIQLPLWPDATRGTPNALLRGALFAAIQGKDRRLLKRELLASVEGLTIRSSGTQLCQTDLTVWEMLVHLTRLQEMGNRVEFTAHAILKALGRDTGKSQHEWLKDVIARLSSAAVEITSANLTFGGALLKYKRDEITGHHVVWLDEDLLKLYKSGWTQIDAGARDALSRKPLALWLHGWYSSHAKPHPIKIETIHKLCGSANTCMRDFKRKLATALDDIKAVGVIVAWEIIGDLVHVERTPTASQQKHLEKKARASRKPK